MSSTLQTNRINISVDTKNVLAKTKLESTFWKDAEASRFFTTPMLLIIVACIGGFGAAYGIKDSVFQLGVITIPAAAVLAMILSLAPMRIIVAASILSVLLSMLVIIF